jgi:hypothetical protein
MKGTFWHIVITKSVLTNLLQAAACCFTEDHKELITVVQCIGAMVAGTKRTLAYGGHHETRTTQS